MSKERMSSKSRLFLILSALLLAIGMVACNPEPTKARQPACESGDRYRQVVGDYAGLEQATYMEGSGDEVALFLQNTDKGTSLFYGDGEGSHQIGQVVTAENGDPSRNIKGGLRVAFDENKDENGCGDGTISEGVRSFLEALGLDVGEGSLREVGYKFSVTVDPFSGEVTVWQLNEGDLSGLTADGRWTLVTTSEPRK